MRELLHTALFGAAAGAAGTTALNAVTYLDMAVRARPSSTTPQDTVERLSERFHRAVPGSGADRQNRLTGLGALTGILAGVGVGSVLGMARSRWQPPFAMSAALAAGAALLAGNGPMALLGVSDPRTWPPSAWIADAIPHLAYGAVTAAALDRLVPA